MIITNVVVARAIWLLDTSELNPSGKYIYDQLFSWLAERYHFAKAPAHARDQVDNAWEFLDGRFNTSANTSVTISLRVYNDGVVGETRSSTEDAEAFLADALSAAVREVGLTFTGSMVHRRMYLSELNLSYEELLNSINPDLNEFTTELTKAFGPQCELVSMAFGSENSSQPGFKLERKMNVPFSQNKYWSIAGLSTSAHMKLLEQFEALLSARP